MYLLPTRTALNSCQTYHDAVLPRPRANLNASDLVRVISARDTYETRRRLARWRMRTRVPFWQTPFPPRIAYHRDTAWHF